jgi:hypothetical protein
MQSAQLCQKEHCNHLKPNVKIIPQLVTLPMIFLVFWRIVSNAMRMSSNSLLLNLEKCGGITLSQVGMEFTFLVRGTGTLPRLISKATSEFKISSATFLR